MGFGVKGLGLRIVFCIKEFSMGFPITRGTFFGGPSNKDCGILGSIVGCPYLGKVPYGSSNLRVEDLPDIVPLE